MAEPLTALLRDAVTAAVDRSPFYQRLYGGRPVIEMRRDFEQLPVVTRQHLSEPGIERDLICMEDEQLVMELNPLTSGGERSVPFTPLENEHDMERRYRRISKLLKHAGADTQRMALVCDKESIYFAAEIERVLPWPIALILRSDRMSGEPDAAEKLGSHTLVLATMHPLSRVPKCCRLIVTFNGATPTLDTLPPECRVVDVYTVELVPWVAISDSDGIYHAWDEASAGDSQETRQLYFERGEANTLLVTALHAPSEPGAIPIIRYDTGLCVSAVTAGTFAARGLSKWR